MVRDTVRTFDPYCVKAALQLLGGPEQGGLCATQSGAISELRHKTWFFWRDSSLGEPDPFRLRYRKMIAETVEAIVRGTMDRGAAIHFIRREVDEKAPPEDRARLVELIETEVMSLHEGNFARFQVRPSEYQAWRGGWR